MARRLRGTRSLREAARAAHLDPGHLSRIERDLRPPTVAVALALDTLYGTENRLTALAEAEADLSPAARRLMALFGPLTYRSERTAFTSAGRT
ncbi:helix-turn-helix domain-containing protein [Paractinoplanes atraurantiacus]|uniref:helix-turn-helix domain-containing protein n=1 Tax=Paractinoplanes atraurantiacus TaxID=1036182 RepID=UPI000BE45204|nr:helix-turn-helix transcriptional regulator [Actinoplanes atraurantiacus]